MADLVDPSPVVDGKGTLPSPDPAAVFQQIQDLLRAKDDTSRFVGLALLKSVLDNQPQLRDDRPRIIELWEAISAKFLDRLLRAGQRQKVSKEESKDMTDIAVTVLHTFAVILPQESLSDKKFISRIVPLTNALLTSSPETTLLILQTLLTLCSSSGGGLALIEAEDISPLTEITVQQPLVLDVLSIALTTTAPENNALVCSAFDKLMTTLLVSFRDTDAVTLITFVGNLLPRLPSEALSVAPSWLKAFVMLLKKLVLSRPTSAARSAYTETSSALIQVYPSATSMLFKDTANANADLKPFSYLFINLILIDIRSSFPSLLSKLNNTEYPVISKRLSSAFDIISSFVGYLVRSMDEQDFGTGQSGFTLPPDLLLKLRKDIAETMSLTIEYLRDRWDASVAGTAGLHPSARENTAVTSEGSRLTLTWESMKDDVSADPLILASIRALAIWLREDENENLRKESAGLMDMLVELYRRSSQSGVDFRYPILMAVEGVLASEESIEIFLTHGGWETISADLVGILRDGEGPGVIRGIEIVRNLLMVIDSESTTQPQEEWMSLVETASSIKPTTSTKPEVVEFQIAMLQLAVALLDLASAGMQKRHFTRISGVVGVASQLSRHITKSFPAPLAQDFQESLQDVNMSLENLR